jgi:peptidase A4-like protein
MLGRRLLRSALLIACALVAVAVTPAGALADTATSSNWSGYAAHRAGVRFRRVSASWVQPAATCESGRSTYSSFWVGLGGFNKNTAGLEQIGTALNCTASGRQRSGAWYELVPAPARPISMTVKQGDHLTASVTVVGHRVTMRLRDRTRGELFSRQLTTQSIDVSSAEWIAEAPSACNYVGSCQGLPLANFGRANFSRGGAQTAGGQHGTISSGAWDHTRILLSQGASPFTGLDTDRSATPSALGRGGTAFSIRYGQSQAVGARAAKDLAASLRGDVQPGGARR